MSQIAVPPSAEPATAPAAPSILPLRSYGLPARSAAEAAGSFLLVFAGLGVTILNTQAGVQPTLAFGFALAAAMVAFGYVSGGHFNPAVTLGSAAAGRTAWQSVLPYILSQLVGGAAAAGLLWLLVSANAQLTDVAGLFGSAANGFDEHSAAQFPLTSAFLAEVAATAILVAVFLGATSHSARRGTAPFAVGLTYAALLTFLLPITNGSLNPARSTASAIFTGTWALEQLWLFWAAPVVGAVIAGLIYRSIDADPAVRISRSKNDAGEGKDAVPAKDAAAAAPQAERSEKGGHSEPVADTAGSAAPAGTTAHTDEPATADGQAAEPSVRPAPADADAEVRSFFDKNPGTTGRN